MKSFSWKAKILISILSVLVLAGGVIWLSGYSEIKLVYKPRQPFHFGPEADDQRILLENAYLLISPSAIARVRETLGKNNFPLRVGVQPLPGSHSIRIFAFGGSREKNTTFLKEIVSNLFSTRADRRAKEYKQVIATMEVQRADPSALSSSQNEKIVEYTRKNLSRMKAYIPSQKDEDFEVQ